MSSKLNCCKFQINHNETKFQKYLRAKNERILEKCFNIKKEKTVEESSKAVIDPQETKNEMLSDQTSQTDSCQQTSFESISLTTSNTQEEDLRKTPTIETTASEDNKNPQKTEQAIKTKSFAKNMQSAKSTPHFNCPNNNRSISVDASKYLKTKQPTRSASSTNWKSPFNSFTTKGTSTRLKYGQQSLEFSYDLSRDELKFAGKFRAAMKPAPEAERQILNSGQRREYLMQRYEHSPVVKYNYPEATSWRIGWLQQKQ